MFQFAAQYLHELVAKAIVVNGLFIIGATGYFISLLARRERISRTGWKLYGVSIAIAIVATMFCKEYPVALVCGLLIGGGFGGGWIAATFLVKEPPIKVRHPQFTGLVVLLLAAGALWLGVWLARVAGFDAETVWGAMDP